MGFCERSQHLGNHRAQRNRGRFEIVAPFPRDPAGGAFGERAAILAEPARFAGQRVGVVLSGGNVDLDALPWGRA